MTQVNNLLGSNSRMLSVEPIQLQWAETYPGTRWAETSTDPGLLGRDVIPPAMSSMHSASSPQRLMAWSQVLRVS